MIYNFPQRSGGCLSSTVRKKSQNLFAFSTDENSETLYILYIFLYNNGYF